MVPFLSFPDGIEFLQIHRAVCIEIAIQAPKTDGLTVLQPVVKPLPKRLAVQRLAQLGNLRLDLARFLIIAVSLSVGEETPALINME